MVEERVVSPVKPAHMFVGFAIQQAVPGTAPFEKHLGGQETGKLGTPGPVAGYRRFISERIGSIERFL